MNHLKAAPALGDARKALRRDAGRELVMMGLLLALGALAVADWAGLGDVTVTVMAALALFALASVVVWRGLAWHPHARFGPANRITLGRLAAVALFGALALVMAVQPLPDPTRMAWGLVVLSTLAAVADAADGPLARASGLASPFGARFDMETDALLILVLCVLIVQFDKAGAWVLAAGLMRYAFVAAARVWPWLAAPLPASLRRKAVCVGQIVALIVCLGPVIPREVSSAIAAVGLGALAGSFGADVMTLRRKLPPPSA